MSQKKDKITYQYKFKFSNNLEKEFYVNLDKKTLDLIHIEKESYPEWTELKCFKCLNCPMEDDKHKFCPVAINLIDLVDFFKDSISYEEVDILIETEARKYMKHTTLQQGLASLIGIYMVTGGCPIMGKLRPMVCYHLPFSTLEETKYRVITMYLLAQYFLYKRGKNPDWELHNLIKIYDDIKIVNQWFCKRLSSIKIQDASLNAVVILNCFADFVAFSIDKNMLSEIELLFNSYF